ncbi:NAD(P)-dependent dehydrogenase (Short-subunit alcohol dehydrogenase family) OS=Ureibacillus acetophenoni OX=614649 GN=SAMN05877842_11397 PE=3 SV=1 [Ureibacillus acetophenoni]
MKLKDKVSIITGGASGIGKAIAESFSKEGAVVVITDLPNSNGEDLSHRINEKGGKSIFLPADVTNEKDMEEVVIRTIDLFGRIDILHNNAGIATQKVPLEENDLITFNRILEVNLVGAFIGTKAVIPFMKKEKRGVILFTGSTGAVRPRVGLSLYNASKAGLIAMSKTLALELAPFNIRVNCINPSATNTKMLTAEQRVEFIKNIPLQRIGEPEDIGALAVFLSSDEANMITGVDWNVDGGRCI